MGHHYVPQAYLRAFGAPGSDGLIWMYDRNKRRWSRAAIDKVAQQKGYYATEVETILATTIEAPANAIFAKLRAGIVVTEDERISFALYLGTMIKRVPRRRRQGMLLLPSAVNDTLAEFRVALVDAYRDRGLAASTIQKHDGFFERLRERLLKEPPAEVLEQLRTPWPSQQMVTLLALMPWRIGRTVGDDAFITSDNPAFFFEGLGLRDPKAELTFPLAPDLALFASWQGQFRTTTFVRVRSQLVKESVRRVISTAERFIFAPDKFDWVETVASKKRLHLNEIRW